MQRCLVGLLTKFLVSVHSGDANSFLNKNNDMLLSRVIISQVELLPISWENFSFHECQGFPVTSLHCFIHWSLVSLVVFYLPWDKILFPEYWPHCFWTWEAQSLTLSVMTFWKTEQQLVPQSSGQHFTCRMPPPSMTSPLPLTEYSTHDNVICYALNTHFFLWYPKLKARMEMLSALEAIESLPQLFNSTIVAWRQL